MNAINQYPRVNKLQYFLNFISDISPMKAELLLKLIFYEFNNKYLSEVQWPNFDRKRLSGSEEKYVYSSGKCKFMVYKQGTSIFCITILKSKLPENIITDEKLDSDDFTGFRIMYEMKSNKMIIMNKAKRGREYDTLCKWTPYTSLNVEKLKMH